MPPHRARAILFAVMLVTLLGTSGVAMPYPILAPLFLANQGGVTRFAGLHPKLLLGIVLALYPLGLLVGSSFIGALSDRYGRRRILTVTLLLSACGYVVAGLALLAGNYAVFALTRLLTGVCEGNIAVARATATDLHPVIDRTRALSLVFATAYAGWLVGPLTGGYLAPLGAHIAFFVAAGALLLGAIAVRVFLESTPTHAADAAYAAQTAGATSATRASVWREVVDANSFGLLRHPDIRPLFVLHLLFTLGLNAYYDFYPVWLVETFAYDSRRIATATAILTGSMILCSTWLVTPLARAVGKRRAVVLSITAFTLLLGMLPWVRPAAAVLALFAVQGATIAIHNGSFSSWMSEAFQREGQGRVLGLLVTVFCTANVIISLVGSWLTLWGGRWALFGGAVCAAAATLMLQRVRLPVTGPAPVPALEAAPAA